jgi:hypothetical protein
MDWLRIFETGTRTDQSGNTKNWTKDDLDHVVATYDPAEHEAPVIIGEARDDAPAYGWIEALKREGNALHMKLKSAVPEFLDMVRKGLFKRRAVSFYPDWTLRHVGFLGAPPPKIDGLNNINFTEEEGSVMTFTTEDENISAGEKLDRLVRDRLASNRDLTYGQAFVEVQAENPELTQQYIEEMTPPPPPKEPPPPAPPSATSSRLDELIRAKLRQARQRGIEMNFREAFEEVQLDEPELTKQYVAEIYKD